MISKLVVGCGDSLDIACEAWRSSTPGVAVEKIEVMQDKSYNFDLTFLQHWSANQATAFVALDDRFLNFKRLELMGILKAQGFQMPACVSPTAIVGQNVSIGENAFIGDGAVIGSSTQISYNAYIGSAARLGYGCRLGHSVWIENCAVLGNKVTMGAHTSVGIGVVVANQVEIGKLCEIRVPGFYKDAIPAKTYYNPNFSEPMRIYN